MRVVPAAVLASLGTLKFRLTLAGTLALALGIGSSVAVLMHKAESDTFRKSKHDQLSEAVRGAAQLQQRVAEPLEMWLHARRPDLQGQSPMEVLRESDGEARIRKCLTTIIKPAEP